MDERAPAGRFEWPEPGGAGGTVFPSGEHPGPGVGAARYAWRLGFGGSRLSGIGMAHGRTRLGEIRAAMRAAAIRRGARRLPSSAVDLHPRKPDT